MLDFSSFKSRQWYLLVGIASFLVGGFIVYGLTSMNSPKVQKKAGLKSSITSGSSRINPKDAWVHKFTNEADVTNKRLDAMEDMLLKILKLNEPPKDKQQSINPIQTPSNTDSLKNDNSSLEAVRKSLKEEQLSSQNLVPVSGASGQLLPPIPGMNSPQLSVPTPGGAAPIQASHGIGGTASSFRSKGLRKTTLSLKNARSSTPLKTVDNTIPAGTFASAVLLGGVDASVSIQASSDPRPALLRITDLGTLPRKFHSDLKGCHALAASYGDISSERVFMRLEKVTCTERKTGEIIEVKVQGYVAGEDGRAGIRGTVVDRAGESMRNAMVGGFLGGVGEFLSQSRNPITFSPIAGLAQTNPMGLTDMAKYGAGKGVSNALDKYADFYIKRAEQVQPVLQIAAGRHVDIVFTEGVSIGDSVYRQAVGKSRDQERYQQIQAVNEEGSPKSLNAWTSSSDNSTNGSN